MFECLPGTGIKGVGRLASPKMSLDGNTGLDHTQTLFYAALAQSKFMRHEVRNYKSNSVILISFKSSKKKRTTEIKIK